VESFVERVFSQPIQKRALDRRTCDHSRRIVLEEQFHGAWSMQSVHTQKLSYPSLFRQQKTCGVGILPSPTGSAVDRVSHIVSCIHLLVVEMH
jgi:hypothetical protein